MMRKPDGPTATVIVFPVEEDGGMLTTVPTADWAQMPLESVAPDWRCVFASVNWARLEKFHVFPLLVGCTLFTWTLPYAISVLAVHFEVGRVTNWNVALKRLRQLPGTKATGEEADVAMLCVELNELNPGRKNATRPGISMVKPSA